MDADIHSKIISFIRTLVPGIVGQIIAWIAILGILDTTGEINSALTVLLTALIPIVYYAIVRFLEAKVSSKFGWLLGYPAQPKYKKSE